jgi:hypothetical protein
VVFVNASSLAAQEAAQDLMEAMLDVPEPASRLPKKGVSWSPPPLVGATRLLRAGGTAQHQLAGLAHVRRGSGGPRQGQPPRDAHARRSVPGGSEALPDGSHRPAGLRSWLRSRTFREFFERDAGSGRVEHLLVGFDTLPQAFQSKEPPIQGNGGRFGRGSECRPRPSAWQGFVRFSRPSVGNGGA